MDPASLATAMEAARRVGGKPFFVGATAGTTVIGAFDPLPDIAAVCQQQATEEPIWLHVDGAWGGGAIFSPNHRHLMQGVDLVDSFSMSLHKMMGAALQCCVFLSRHPGLLTRANATNAAYLFQKDKLHAQHDFGDKTIQCSRKPDCLKMWLLWKTLGDEGLASRVDHAMMLARHLAARIAESGGAFVLAYPPSYSNVCFWYVPSSMRPLPPPAALHASHPIGTVAPAIKAGLQRHGAALIGFQSINKLPNFFRWVFASTAGVTTADVDAILGRLATLGEEAASSAAA